MVAVRSIYGIDFSGAKDAGNKIWIAKGVPDGKRLLIQECSSAAELLNSGEELLPNLAALIDLVTTDCNSAFGLDFPFGLPRSLVHEGSWEEFVLEFTTRFHDPEHFRARCFSEARNKERRRQTDNESHTPLSPYNLYIYKQTYYGITKVLRPLIQDRRACILPFHKPVVGKPWVLEICPASTLRAYGLNRHPYKKGTETHRNNRRQILEAIEGTGQIHIEQAEMRQTIIDDNGGDALDSLVAALAVWRAFQKVAYLKQRFVTLTRPRASSTFDVLFSRDSATLGIDREGLHEF